MANESTPGSIPESNCEREIPTTRTSNTTATICDWSTNIHTTTPTIQPDQAVPCLSNDASILGKELSNTSEDEIGSTEKATNVNKLTVMSANANSLKNKLTSLKFNISILKPDIIVIQETKLKRKAQIQLKGYRLYETVRGDNGGGLLIAALVSLEPVLIYEGDCECEVLVVQVTIDNMHIRIIAGYGPQECAPTLVREKYRSTVEEQVARSYLAGCMILVAEDSNAKLGPTIIMDDPNPMSENGKLLAGMISRQGLNIINKSSKCIGGPVTRRRTVNGKTEESCIDFILVSKELDSYLQSAAIDSSQLYALTKYTTTKGNPSVKRSDHFTLTATFDIKWSEKKPPRKEIFKLRDENSLRKFYSVTTKSNKLRICVKENSSLQDACSKWYKHIDKYLYQCFKRIRITEKPPKRTIEYQIYQQLLDVKVLKEQYSTCHIMQKSVVHGEIRRAEQRIAELQGEKCRKIITEDMKHLLNEDGSFSFNDAWKLKQKMFPKCTDAPFAVFDTSGNLVTDYNGILDVMKHEYKFRLRNREIDPQYKELRELKEYLCMIRLQISKLSDYKEWTRTEPLSTSTSIF